MGVCLLVFTVFLLSLLAAVSPIVFLNASTVLAHGGASGALRFLAGNYLVVAVLGLAALGLLGASAASLEARLVASRTVDRFLGVALLAYGGLLLYRMWQHRAQTGQVRRPSGGGEFGWGVLGMATNFTSIPLVLSIGNRLGTQAWPGAARVAVLLFLLVIVVTPAWLPLAISRLTRRRADLRPATRRKVQRTTALISAVACLVGGVVLIVFGAR